MAERGVLISEAAPIMGMSVDALRKRVQRHSVKAYKGADDRWRVVLDDYDADADIPDTPTPAETRAGTPVADLDTARRAGGIMAVQEMLAPFIAELGTVREELGREKEKREQAERERDRLRLEIARLQSVQRHDQRAAPEAPPQREDESPPKAANVVPEGTQREIDPSAGDGGQAAGKPQRWPWWMRLLGGK